MMLWTAALKSYQCLFSSHIRVVINNSSSPRNASAKFVVPYPFWWLLWLAAELQCIAGFEGLDTVPSTFVLMGNFSSQPTTTASTDYSAIKEQFKSLANIIVQYPRLQVSLLHVGTLVAH